MSADFARRIGIVSIGRTLPDPWSMPFDRLYPAIGQNTGNLMFTEAAYRLIDAEAHGIGFAFDPEAVNRSCDAVVIPAANWLNAKSNWDALTERIQALTVPVVLIGLGLQAASDRLEDVVVTDSALNLVRTIAARSTSVSVRGAFTARFLASQGISNTTVTGCPSLYMTHLWGQAAAPVDEIVLQSTRYGLTAAFAGASHVQRLLFQLAAGLDQPMIFQSEREEMQILTGNPPGPSAALFAQTYGMSRESVEDWLARKGEMFFNLASWSRFLKARRGVIGTRLHGVILSLISGRSARLITHDSRTREMAAFAGIPTLDGAKLSENTSFERLSDLLDQADLVPWRTRRRENAKGFVTFLQEAGLKPAASLTALSSPDEMTVRAA